MKRIQRSLIAITLLLALSAPFSSCLVRKDTTQLAPEEFDVSKLPPNAERKFTKLFFDATKAKLIGDLNEARKLFLEALSVNPNSAVVKFELSRIYANDGNLSTAIDYARDAHKSNPENIWYAEFLGQLYAEVGRLDESVKIFRSIIAKDPTNYDYYFHLAGILSAQGKYDEALKVYQELEEKVGIIEEVSTQKQILYMEKGDYSKAMIEIERLIESNPSEIRYYGIKAELFQKIGRDDDAKALYKEMLEMEPDNGLVLLSLYEIYKKEGREDDAHDYLNKAFLSPELGIDVKVNVLLNMMGRMSFRKESEKILGLGSSLELSHPNDAKTYAIQGDLHYNLGNLIEARNKFRKAVELDANRPPIWQQILTINSQLSDFEAMITESNAAMEIFPEQPVFYLFHGVALLSQKKVSPAIESLVTGKNLVVDNAALQAQFLSSLGDAYHEMGKHDQSDEAYEKALNIEPSNVLVLNNYAYYLAIRKENLEKAEKMAKKANDLQPDEASFQDTYGWVLYMRGNYQNALFWIEQALRNGAENDAVVLEHHGDVLIKINRKSDAVRSWQSAIDAGGDKESISKKIQSVGE